MASCERAGDAVFIEIILEGVDWLNNRRLLESIGAIPSMELEHA